MTFATRIKRQFAQLVPWSNTFRFLNYAARTLEAVDQEEIAFIRQILGRLRNQGGNTFQLQEYKLWSICRLLEERKPRSILEIGSGASTPMFATYTRFSGATMLSVEEHDDWMNFTRELLADFGLLQFVDFLNTPTRWELDHDPPRVTYEAIPQKEWDFVFVDGPTLTYQGRNLRHAICFDVFELLENCEVKTIVVDMRRPTADALHDLLRAEWQCSVSDVLKRNPCSEFEYYSVFRKGLSKNEDE